MLDGEHIEGSCTQKFRKVLKFAKVLQTLNGCSIISYVATRPVEVAAVITYVVISLVIYPVHFAVYFIQPAGPACRSQQNFNQAHVRNSKGFERGGNLIYKKGDGSST